MNEEEKKPAKTSEIKPTRLAMIISRYTIEDYPILLKNLLLGLADKSIPVTIICPHHGDIKSIITPSTEIIRHPFFNLPLMTAQNRKKLSEQLELFKPTMIQCLCHTQASLARHLAREFSLPYLLHVNSLQKRFSQISLSYKRLAKIIVPADSIKDNLKDIYPKYSEKIERINIGTFVDDKKICFSGTGHLPGMITAHTTHDAADFENLLNAVRHLAIDGYEFVLIIACRDRIEKELRKLINALGLTNIATLIPKLRPWRSVIAAADIFIQPRPLNYFNPLLLKAMSVGTAVATCTGGVDELIIDGQTATTFDPQDELSIYNKLRQLLDRPELARKLANQARQNLRQNYSVSNMISEIFSAYNLPPNTLPA